MRPFLSACLFFMYTSLIGKFPSYNLRHAYLRRVLRLVIGKGGAIHMGCFITGRKISIGARVVVNRRCYLDGRGGLAIGDDVSISPECYIITLTHDVNDPCFIAVAKPVAIHSRVWIGARAIVLPGVTLGEGCVVGAGAVVTKDVQPYSVVAGNPAREIGKRSKDLSYQLTYRPLFDTDVQ